MTILILETNRQFAEVIGVALRTEDDEFVVASTPERANRFLDERQVDAVVLNARVDRRSGIRWLESLAVRQPDLARRALVYFKGEPHELDLRRVERLGAGVLLEPASPREWIEAFVKQIVDSD